MESQVEQMMDSFWHKLLAEVEDLTFFLTCLSALCCRRTALRWLSVCSSASGLVLVPELLFNMVYLHIITAEWWLTDSIISCLCKQYRWARLQQGKTTDRYFGQLQDQLSAGAKRSIASSCEVIRGKSKRSLKAGSMFSNMMAMSGTTQSFSISHKVNFIQSLLLVSDYEVLGFLSGTNIQL